MDVTSVNEDVHKTKGISRTLMLVELLGGMTVEGMAEAVGAAAVDPAAVDAAAGDVADPAAADEAGPAGG
jgi:hypothetical protein